VGSLQTRMAKQEETVDAKVKTLDESLEKATAILKRNSADVGAQVDQLTKDAEVSKQGLEAMREELAAMRKEIAALRDENARLRAEQDQRLAQVEGRVDAIEKKKPEPIKQPPDKDAMFAAAKGKAEAGQYNDARTELRAFVKQYPKDDRADDAQYLLADTYVKERQWEKAIAEFQKLLETYPDADHTDDGFMGAGLAAIQLKWCVDAGAYLGELVRRFPKSPLVKDAKAKLAWLKKNQNNKKVCS
jgi:tol-pal system protein YbgF